LGLAYENPTSYENAQEDKAITKTITNPNLSKTELSTSKVAKSFS
jgi:hypothetical protein